MGNGTFLKGTVQEYLSELSARTIVPGGGSASALAAAVGAALNLMVISYSIDGKTTAGEREKLLALQRAQKDSLDRLSRLVDEDCEAFRALMKALSGKKDAQEEYAGAAGAPMSVCRECGASMGITRDLLGVASKKLISDVGCAAHILAAAFRSARLNVEVNLKYMTDRSFVDSVRDQIEDIAKDVEARSREVISGVDGMMNARG